MDTTRCRLGQCIKHRPSWKEWLCSRPKTMISFGNSVTSSFRPMVVPVKESTCCYIKHKHNPTVALWIYVQLFTFVNFILLYMFPLAFRFFVRYVCFGARRCFQYWGALAFQLRRSINNALQNFKIAKSFHLPLNAELSWPLMVFVWQKHCFKIAVPVKEELITLNARVTGYTI